MRVLTPRAMGYRRLLAVDAGAGTAYLSASPEPTEGHLYRVALQGEQWRMQRLTYKGRSFGAFARKSGLVVCADGCDDGSRHFLHRSAFWIPPLGYLYTQTCLSIDASVGYAQTCLSIDASVGCAQARQPSDSCAGIAFVKNADASDAFAGKIPIANKKAST